MGTEFYVHSLTKRCYFEALEVFRYLDRRGVDYTYTNPFIRKEKDPKMKEAMQDTEPLFYKFFYCMNRPLVKKSIRNELIQCLNKNNGEYLKCQNEWNNFYQKGDAELLGIFKMDNYGLIRSRFVADHCQKSLQEMRTTRCLGSPENPDC